MSIEVVNAVTDLGEARKGVSRAHFFKCDDGEEYLVKFFEDNQDKTAVNEFVAGAIAMRMNLPTPVRVLVNVSDEIISISDKLRERGIGSGLHIGVRRLGNDVFDFEELSEESLEGWILQNRRDLYGVIGFDHWLLNGDRDNNGNNMIQFLNDNQIRYIMVDLGHCFTGDAWTESIENSKGYNYLMPLFSFISKQIKDFGEFGAWFSRIESFTQANINEIVKSIPSAWNLSPNEREVLTDLIVFRRKFPQDILSNNRARLGI